MAFIIRAFLLGLGVGTLLITTVVSLTHQTPMFPVTQYPLMAVLSLTGAGIIDARIARDAK